MSRQTAVQLSLPCSLDEATLLAQHVTSLEAKLTAVHEELADSQASYERLSTYYIASENRLKADLVAQHEEISLLRMHIAGLETQRAFEGYTREARDWRDTLRRHLQDGGSPAPPAWLDGALKQLLTTAHPDKWSQGQPAATLAHELAIAVNGLRARLDGEVLA